MSTETTTSESSARANRSRVRDLTLVALFAALMAICSWISIPATVPFTMQTFGVFVAVGLLGGKRGTGAVLVYILLGAVGLPVFAGFSGGLGSLFGSAGGYIIGFLGSALVMWGMEKLFGTGAVAQIASMLVGLLVCYAFGTAWFMVVYTTANGAVTLMTVLGWCVIPFILPDLLKIALAFLLTGRLKRYVPQ
ncbi:MAG: biotin transporter BioY [Clostridiales bacterium]|nr:biotin transporter BioY [Clostridiales bacterium]